VQNKTKEAEKNKFTIMKSKANHRNTNELVQHELDFVSSQQQATKHGKELAMTERSALISL
jgi:hypothetical protein